MCAWGQRALFVFAKVLAQQLQELFRVLADQLGNVGVPSGNLLQNRLEHLGLLLDELPKLLKVGVGTQEIQVGKGITTPTSSATATTIAGLGSGLEHIEALITTSRGLSGGRSRFRGPWLLLLRRRRRRRRRLCLRFRLLGNTLVSC